MLAFGSSSSFSNLRLSPDALSHHGGGALSQKFTGAVDLFVMLGGSSARVGLNAPEQIGSVEPSIAQISWAAYAKRPENRGKDISGNADHFSAVLAAMTKDLLRKNRVLPSQIRRLNLAVAGITLGSESEPLIRTTNTAVHFDNYPFMGRFRRELSSALNQNVEQGVQLNDAVAGLLGEAHHPRGVARGERNVIYIIVGTGVGGILKSNGRIISRHGEFGHTVVLRDGHFSYWDMRELAARKLYTSGEFHSLNLGMDYLENIVAGPWLAINFVRSILPDYGKRRCLRRLCKDAEITDEQLIQIADLKPTDRIDWATVANGPHISRIGALIGNVSEADTDQTRYRTLEEASFNSVLWNYKKSVHAALGDGIDVLRRRFPDHVVVLGGGVAENFGRDDSFLRRLHSRCGLDADSNIIRVSKLNGEEREGSGLSVAAV